MGGFFQGQEIQPEIKETEWGKKARKYLEDIQAGLGDVEFPELDIAELSPLEQKTLSMIEARMDKGIEYPQIYQTGREELMKTMRGEYDPAESQLYAGFRAASEMEEKEALGELARRSQLGGMLYSEPTQRAMGETMQRYSAGRQQMLGGLTEAERARQYGSIMPAMAAGQYEIERPLALEMENIGLGMGYGSRPREIEQAKGASIYQRQMQELMFPYETGTQISSALMQYQPWYTPQYRQSGFSQLLGFGTQLGAAYLGAYAGRPAATKGG